MKTTLLLALLGPVLLQAQPAPSTGRDGMLDRYLTVIAEQQLAARKTKVAAIVTPADVRARQAYIHAKLLEEIGGFPAKTPLNARIMGTVDRGGYRVEKLIFESQPHYYVTANVFVPTSGKPPYPAILGTAGHSAESKTYDFYQRAWITLARRGFLVLAYDPPGQGERIEYLDRETGKSRLRGGTAEHTMAGLQCLLTGTNIARYFIWDGIRALDYLLTRPDVDAERIAATGNSGGGTQSGYLAAFDSRLAAAAPSCWLTSWEKMWLEPGPQDAEQNFANFLKDGLDFPDFLVAFAPKPIQMATATRDFFPIEGAKATYAEALRTFGVLGAADRMGFFEFDDTHGWSKPRREATYRWLVRWLQKRPDDGIEPPIEIDSARTLQCTETGQVATSFRNAETTQSLNRAVAERLYAVRPGAGGRNIAALIKARLGVTAQRGIPAFTGRSQLARRDYGIETIDIQTEAGITVPALVAVPSSGPARKPAVLYVNAAGKDADAGEGGPIEALARAGRLVLAIDPRGWGETSPAPDRNGGYTKAYRTAMRALLVGKTMAGIQTGDVLRAFDYLNSRPDVDPLRIEIFGKGNGAVLAVYAAALEPRIAKVTCEGGPASYMDLVRAQVNDGITDIVVPGVLRDFDLPDIVAALGPRMARTPAR